MMKNAKWLTALVIAAASLTSNVANAAVYAEGSFELGSTDSIAKLLLSLAQRVNLP